MTRGFAQPLRFALVVWLGVVPLVHAGPGGSAGAVMNLLKSGKVPPQRLGPVLEIVCKRGNAQELAYVLDRVLAPDAFPADVRRDVLHKLADAALTRKVTPDGDLSGIVQLLAADDQQLKAAAIDLCGLWSVEAAIDPLSALAADGETTAETRSAALDAVFRIDPQAAHAVVSTLTTGTQPFAIRSLGISALARIDLAEAAQMGAKALSQAGADDDPSRIVDAFLSRQDGSASLAEALDSVELSEDIAKLALRRMYAVGRSDAALSAVLERAAKIAGDVPAPTGADLSALISTIRTDGDPVRGEEVFRRGDLSCLKCHALSKAGGQIGPDLSAVGANSPVEYLVASVYDPDAQVKEAFVSRTVLTVDGLTVQGIVADRTDDRLVLKDADGRHHEIPLADIDAEVEGKSLMPKGLVKFMTHTEIVDLVAFLAQLGRPGPYAVRSTPRMQRWRVLANASPELLADVPNDTTFEDRVLQSGRWIPAYARVDGTLPLHELMQHTKSPVLYLQGEIDVQTAGPVGVRVESPAPPVVWIDGNSIPFDGEITTDATAGRHSITLRIDAAGHEGGDVRLELFRPEDSNAVFAVVDGQ